MKKEDNIEVPISADLAIVVWDILNEIALNIEKGKFRSHVLRNRNALERAMKKVGLGGPTSGNGRAK